MTGRLADINARIDTVHKLDAVIKAMRGIAAARVREAHQHLQSVRTYASTLGVGIAEVLALAPPLDVPAIQGQSAAIVFAAEQGFAGSFSDRVFDAFERLSGPVQLFTIGSRGLPEAEERGIPVVWQAQMISGPAQAPALASLISDMVFDGIRRGTLGAITVLHAVPGGSHQGDIMMKALMPFDFGRFPCLKTAEPPELTVPPAVLLQDLIEEYVFAQLVEATLLSFAAENEARMRAMIAAQDNTAETLAAMMATSRQLRQEEITEEIIELAVSGLQRG
ncbi:F0F1 ATP synthase subunit gamma [Donghicola sp. XS_ASV15]|uniref:F0F1 ATP synthase subunit gamma n=1 Tax=Donghicola sp. XS_ASV15 TaxID=3241295 RepID=UPI0035188920